MIQTLMVGGGKEIKSLLKSEKVSPVALVVMLVILFLLRALIVEFAYNKVAPKLIGNWSSVSSKDRKFEPLTFNEALLFTILISFLFI
jgi:hypothetical protein